MPLLMALGGLFWLAILAGLGFLVYAAARALIAPAPAAWAAPPAQAAAPDPLALAAARYARGEIGREEYLQIRRDLAGLPSGAPGIAPGGAEQP